MNKTAAHLFFVQHYVGIITPSVGADSRVCPHKYNMVVGGRADTGVCPYSRMFSLPL